MQESVKASKSKRGPVVPRPQKIGMTADEREDFIIFLTRMFDDVPFEHKTFSDGSLGLVVEGRAHEWVTVKRLEDYLGSYESEQSFKDVYDLSLKCEDIMRAVIFQRIMRAMRWTNESS